MPSVLYSIAASLVAVAIAAGSGYWYGRDAGKASVQNAWDAERSAVEAAQATERAATAERLATLAGEVETLRARPERVRTITRTVHVAADAECRSLPATTRELWNAADDRADRSPTGPAAVADDRLPAVASDGRGWAGAD